MIDLHCHVLPGVDDGPVTMMDSVDLARVASRDGVRTIVATPHAADWMLAYKGDRSELETRIDELRQVLDDHAVDVELLPGLEVYLEPESHALYERGRIFTLNSSRYMLVEFPLQTFPVYAEQALFDLQLRQVVPVIAHAERYVELANQPGILERLVARGMLLQVNAGSLFGAFGSQAREMAEMLISRRMAHIIASDGHSARRRPPVLSEAVRRATELIGEEAALAMVTTVPEAILRDEAVSIPEPESARRRSWFPFGRK